MEFQKIEKDTKIFPGEYLLYIPTNKIVVCGAYKQREGKIRALVEGRLIEDKVTNFQKLKLSKEESTTRRVTRRGCGGCKR